MAGAASKGKRVVCCLTCSKRGKDLNKISGQFLPRLLRGESEGLCGGVGLHATCSMRSRPNFDMVGEMPRSTQLFDCLWPFHTDKCGFYEFANHT
jgi:hypothetical protein